MRCLLPTLLGAAIFLMPASASALTKPEKKAVDIKSVNAASTANAAYVEIAFKGQVEDLLGTRGLRKTRLKVRFVPATGKATTIIERGSSEDPQTRRRGTKGKSEVLRAGRTVAVLVRKLPAVAGRVIVTTAGPRKFDKKRKRARGLVTEDTVEGELERLDAALDRMWLSLTGADYRAYDTMDRIKQAKGKRKKRRRQKAKLARLNEIRGDLNARIDFVGHWTKVLDKALKGLAKRECNDGVDNIDPEDSIADFGFDKDPGCLMPLDNDEANAPMTLTCPAPGQSTTVSATLAIAGANTLERFVLSLPPTEADKPRRWIVDAPVTGSRGGPFPLETDITQLCNYEFDFVYGYVVTTQGAPSGSYLLRVAVTAENKGGYPGGAQIPFMLAAGTSR